MWQQRLKETPLPDAEGRFGDYGGCYVPESLKQVLTDIGDTYRQLRQNVQFWQELKTLHADYIGRPSPIFHAQHLSDSLGGGQIYLKREDLNHTGAHKINHCLGEALLAKHMGKEIIIAETGAGQHGVALATAAALVGLECHIYMGEVDIHKERPNVYRMQVLGAKVVPVDRGTRTLKDAVDAAFEAYLEDPQKQLYAIGSVVGPHPFPMMVRDFQQIVGEEARKQFQQKQGKLPEHLVACVGGGSNSLGLFTAFLQDPEVQMHGVEPSGRGWQDGDHAATLSRGRPGLLHGFKSYVLQDDADEALPVYSIASGLDYPSVGPQHSLLKDLGRVHYTTANDKQALDAFFALSRKEGIIPALESAHALAYAMELAAELPPEETILVNLSGRGDKDLDYVVDNYGHDYGIQLPQS